VDSLALFAPTHFKGVVVYLHVISRFMNIVVERENCKTPVVTTALFGVEIASLKAPRGHLV